MIAVLGHLLALALIAGFVALWHRTSPASGSGWAMFAAIIITLSLPAVGVASALGVFVAGALTVGHGFVWFNSRGKEYAGWLLFAAIVSAFSLLSSLG